MKRMMLLLFVASTALAQTTGTISVGGQTDNTSGGVARFRELSEGEQQGFFVETLELRAPLWKLDSQFNTGGRGFADFSFVNDEWRGGVRMTRANTWSGLSFHDDVGQLYPYTTELDPQFGVSDPRVDTTRATAFLARDFGLTTLTLRGGLRDRNGERVPNIGGFSFSLDGAPAFFTPGVESIDASSKWGEVEMATRLFSIAAGASTRSSEMTYALPAYGPLWTVASSYWNGATDADSRWIRATGAFDRERYAVRGALSYSSTSANIAAHEYRAGVVSASDGFTVRNGDATTDVTSGGIGTTFRVGRIATAFAVDMQSRSTDGNALRSLASDAPVAIDTFVDSDRIGATADLSTRFRNARLRLRGRYTTTDTQTDVDDRTLDRGELRADVSMKRLRAWVRASDDSTNYDMDRHARAAGFDISRGALRFSTSVQRTDFENRERLTSARAAASHAWTVGAHSGWAELGYLSTSYAYTDERVRGVVAAAGGELHPLEMTRVDANVELVRDRGDLDRTLTRGSLEVAQTIRTGLEVFGRWTGGNLDAPRALADEYTASLFAVGVRTRF